jgi:hypothetical protein
MVEDAGSDGGEALNTDAGVAACPGESAARELSTPERALFDNLARCVGYTLGMPRVHDAPTMLMSPTSLTSACHEGSCISLAAADGSVSLLYDPICHQGFARSDLLEQLFVHALVCDTQGECDPEHKSKVFRECTASRAATMPERF